MKQAHVLPLLVSIVPALAQSGAFTYLGCYSDDPNSRGLTGQSNAVPANQNSIETCAAACSAYKYFGVEWSVVSLHISKNAISPDHKAVTFDYIASSHLADMSQALSAFL